MNFHLILNEFQLDGVSSVTLIFIAVNNLGAGTNVLCLWSTKTCIAALMHIWFCSCTCFSKVKYVRRISDVYALKILFNF